MTPSPLATGLRNAYEAHDHDEFHRLLKKVVALESAAPPPAAPRRVYCTEGARCQCGGEKRQQCPNWKLS